MPQSGGLKVLVVVGDLPKSTMHRESMHDAMIEIMAAARQESVFVMVWYHARRKYAVVTWSLTQMQYLLV